MGGYRCNNTSCDHCQGEHCGEGGSCITSGCECKGYIPEGPYDQTC